MLFVVVVVVLWIPRLTGGISPYVSLNTYPVLATVLAVQEQIKHSL